MDLTDVIDDTNAFAFAYSCVTRVIPNTGDPDGTLWAPVRSMAADAARAPRSVSVGDIDELLRSSDVDGSTDAANCARCFVMMSNADDGTAIADFVAGWARRAGDSFDAQWAALATLNGIDAATVALWSSLAPQWAGTVGGLAAACEALQQQVNAC